MHTYAHEIASSKFFRDMGIATPLQYPFRAVVEEKANGRKVRNHGVLSQDVQSLDGITCTLANEINEFLG